MSERIPGLNEMNARGREVAHAFYEAGYVAGIADGRAELEREHTDGHALAALIARQAAAHGPYDVLADRRGHHERAERQRTILKERGISA